MYRTRIEPIFLKQRAGGVSCYECHSVLTTRLKLEPLTAGSSWTEEQSRRNFQAVSGVIDLSDPLKSRLLLHPLSAEAGGDPSHGGGKFWTSKEDPEWRTIAEWIQKGSSPAANSTVATGAGSRKTTSLDFESFKAKVEPIFLKARPGHARCYSCHSEAGRPFHLQPLTAGNSNWTEEQSQLNFQSTVPLVSPGDPNSSRLLMHPLAPEAGGDAFHSGGRQFESQHDPDWLAIADWVRAASPPSDPPPSGESALIYVTNSAEDTIDVIDPANNRVVQEIHGIELPHGIAFSPDGSRIYVSNESESVLDVIDRTTGTVVRKVPLSGRPNNMAITKDGRRVLVGIRMQPGSVDVIDTESLMRVKNIPVDGSVHNIFVTPDGKYAVSGSIENKAATIIDLQSEQVAWEVKFDRPVRPMAFEKNPDGSTRRIFVQLSRFHGFAVVDFAKRVELTRIDLPGPRRFGVAEGRGETPSHGIGVAPDGKSLWVNSTVANAVFKYSLPGLQLIGKVDLPEVHPLGRAPTGAVPEWITFTPDSKRVYVSNSAARSVSAIDTTTLKIIALIAVGEVPKRLNTLAVH